MNMYGRFRSQSGNRESEYVERSSFRDKSIKSFLLRKPAAVRAWVFYQRGTFGP